VAARPPGTGGGCNRLQRSLGAGAARCPVGSLPRGGSPRAHRQQGAERRDPGAAPV